MTRKGGILARVVSEYLSETLHLSWMLSDEKPALQRAGRRNILGRRNFKYKGIRYEWAWWGWEEEGGHSIWRKVSRERPQSLIWMIAIASERSCPCESLPTLNPSYCCQSDLFKIVIIDNLMEHIKCIRHWVLYTERTNFFFSKFIYLFIYLFLVVLGLSFCARASSSCGERGPLFIAVRGPLTIAASLIAEHRLQTHRLSSCGSQAQLLRGMWDLPRPGLEPVSPALAGGFSTTAPPGKPHSEQFNHITATLWR